MIATKSGGVETDALWGEAIDRDRLLPKSCFNFSPSRIVCQVTENLTEPIVGEVGAAQRCTEQVGENRSDLSECPILNSHLTVVSFRENVGIPTHDQLTD